MSRRDPGSAIRDMISHAEEAIDLVAGKTRGDLDRDRVLQLAIVRLVEIVGEAARRVPEMERANVRNVPWRAIVGMRDHLIHGYHAVDLDILWIVVQDDLPALVGELRKTLPREPR